MDVKKMVTKYGMTALGVLFTVGGYLVDKKSKDSTVSDLENKVDKLEKLVARLTDKKTD